MGMQSWGLGQNDLKLVKFEILRESMAKNRNTAWITAEQILAFSAWKNAMQYTPGKKRGPQESWLIFTASLRLEKTSKIVKVSMLSNIPSREVKNQAKEAGSPEQMNKELLTQARCEEKMSE